MGWSQTSVIGVTFKDRKFVEDNRVRAMQLYIMVIFSNDHGLLPGPGMQK